MDKNQIIIMSAEDIDNLANIVANIVFDKISTMQQTNNTASDKPDSFQIKGTTMILPAKEPPLPSINEDYLNTEDVVKILKKHPSTLSQYIKNGKITPITLGRRNYFYISDVLKLNQQINDKTIKL